MSMALCHCMDRSSGKRGAKSTRGQGCQRGVTGQHGGGRQGGDAMKLAFLGLGVMGYPMAGHLAKAGHQVTVYNRSPAKAEAWVKEYGGGPRGSPAPGGGGGGIVFTFARDQHDTRAGAG